MTRAANLAEAAGSGFAFRNRIINGAMMIDQRNAGASVNIGTANTVIYTVDRWYGYGSQASKFTVQQNAGSVTPPAGFINYLGITVASSSYTPVSAEEFNIAQPIEGFNISDLAWGSSNAKTVTLSFWVYSSLTGTFGGSLRQGSGAYSYPFTYTVSTANTWTQISIVISGSTAGTWNTNNGTGILVGFSLGAGSSKQATPGAWTSGNYSAATGQINVLGTANATFYITGIQLEKGSVATPSENRLYGTEFALCQRYFWLLNTYQTPFNVVWYASAIRLALACPVVMRAAPTITLTGATAGAMFSTTNDANYTNFSYSSATTQQLTSMTAIWINGSADTTAGGGPLFMQAGRILSVSAEL